ncbi:CaiB/BaiF CoA transferase family protein [Chloroflexota bacterium]
MAVNKLLEGVRILENGIFMALPLAGRMLSEFGAEVIKIESHTALDPTMYLPYYAPGLAQIQFQGAKRRALLNLRHPKAKPIFNKLLGACDIFMTNFPKRVLDSWGTSFSEMRAINPQLIILWVTGMGSTGPHATWKVVGNLVQHSAGLTTMTGFTEVPNIVNTSYSDYHASVFDVMAIVAALHRLRRTGQGSLIECSIFKSGVFTVGPAVLDYQATERGASPIGNKDIMAAPHGIYPCKGEDRWCAIAVFTDIEWGAFCNIVGNPNWTREPRFATLVGRLRNVDELDELVGEWTKERTAQEVMEKMQEAGVKAGIVSKGEDLAQSPHLRERGFYRETTYYVSDLDKPGAEWEESPPVISSPVPVNFSETPLPFGHMHRIGEDNGYVYGELLGMSGDEIKALTEEQVLF